MIYALVALVGATTVWIAQTITKRRLRSIHIERRVTLYNSGAQDWQRIGVRLDYDGKRNPSLMVADIPGDPNVAPTWIALDDMS